MVQRGVSNYQIQSWLDCPYRIWLEYFRKCKPIYWRPELFDVGRLVHKSVEKYYENWYSSNPSYEHILYYMYEELKKLWEKVMTQIEGDVAVKNLQKAYTCLQNMAVYEYKRAKKNSYKPHIELTKDIAGYYIKVDGFDEQLGKAWDIKTGTNASKSWQNIVQACVYKNGLDALFDINLEKFEFYYPQVNKPIIVNFSGKKELEWMDKVKHAREEIQKGFQLKKFPKQPKTPNTCNYCNLRHYCKVKKL